MNKNLKQQVSKRVEFIKNILIESKAKGIVLGFSGGKDSALVGILCKKACDNTVGIIMPCESKRNFNEDAQDALLVASNYNIKTLCIDLTSVKKEFVKTLSPSFDLSGMASANINPRLRMITLYAYAHAHNMLVAGTGNASEAYMGYFTKWGDGAYDFNPIGDMKVEEIYDMLAYLNAPKAIMNKPPSAALFEGQTDEKDMRVTYKETDAYLSGEKLSEESRRIIENYHNSTQHKRMPPPVYENN